MAPAANKTTILGFALNFLAANFNLATEECPVTFREEDVAALAEEFKDEEAFPSPQTSAGLPHNFTDCVIEKAGENYFVTLHENAGKAINHAVAIAKENTGYTEAEILRHLQSRSSHEEGDYGVFLAVATHPKGQ
jgi:hypothetical protein